MIEVVKCKANDFWWIWYRHEQLNISYLSTVLQFAFVLGHLVKPTAKHEIFDIWWKRNARLLLNFGFYGNGFAVSGNNAVRFLYLVVQNSCYLHMSFTCASLLRFDCHRSCRIQISRTGRMHPTLSRKQRILQIPAQFRGCSCYILHLDRVPLESIPCTQLYHSLQSSVS